MKAKEIERGKKGKTEGEKQKAEIRKGTKSHKGRGTVQAVEDRVESSRPMIIHILAVLSSTL